MSCQTWLNPFRYPLPLPLKKNSRRLCYYVVYISLNHNVFLQISATHTYVASRSPFRPPDIADVRIPLIKFVVPDAVRMCCWRINYLCTCTESINPVNPSSRIKSCFYAFNSDVTIRIWSVIVLETLSNLTYEDGLLNGSNVDTARVLPRWTSH